ncbi:MAG: hypothetical protein O7D34_12055 [Ignavibacteria bacterium]|nr:hypothetical protein [Ignavibacteria bacterium]
MRKISTLALAIFVTSAALSEDGGSNYSTFGIGDLRYAANVRSAGMGYTGIGLPAADYVNSISPATWARIQGTRLEASFLYEGFNSTDGNKSIYLANGDFNGVLLAIPISPAHGIVFVGGFTPYSNVRYNIFTTGTEEGIDYTVNHLGSGGLGKGQVGLSYSPLTDLSFGASFNYLFGSLDNSRTFTPTSTSFAGGKTVETTNINGITVSLGGLFTSLGNISESLRPFSIGFVINSRGNLNTKRQLAYEFQSERDSSEVFKGRLVVPIAYGFGVAYQPSKRFLFAADYYAQPWKTAEFNGVNPIEIRNSYRFGLGAERLPVREFNASWLNKFAYRLGFYFISTYYKINGEPINEWGVTGGFGMPLTRSTRLNVGIEYGQRGTTSHNLIKDNIFRISLSLNVGELWFVRFQEE